MLPCCVEERLATTPWSPLGGGWLTGKYRRNERPSGATRLEEDPNRGVEAYDRRDTERTWRILDAVRSVADRRGCAMAHVAIAWLLGRPTVASELLGARTRTQLDEVLGGAALDLGDDDRALLDTVSTPGLPDYPYGMTEEHCGVTHWRQFGTR